MQEMYLLTSLFFNFGQRLDEVNLRLMIHGINEKEHHRDEVVDDSSPDSRSVTEVKSQGFKTVLLHPQGLRLATDGGIDVVRRQEVGGREAVQKSTTKVARPTCNEDVMHAVVYVSEIETISKGTYGWRRLRFQGGCL